MDEHWRPAYLDCNPCQHSFDIILKTESMNYEKETIINQLSNYYRDSSKLKNELNSVWNRWGNKSPKIFQLENWKANNSRRSSTTIIENSTTFKSSHVYFSQVSKADLERLYHVYRPDFELFQYSPWEYIEIGKS